MQYVIEYIATKKLPKQTYDQINHIRLCKQALIPAKVIGVRGRRDTECYYDINANSSLLWCFNFPIKPKPILIVTRAWNEFK